MACAFDPGRSGGAVLRSPFSGKADPFRCGVVRRLRVSCHSRCELRRGRRLAVSAAGVFFLVRWFDSGQWMDSLLFTLCAALLWRVHLIFWPFYFVFAIYAATRLRRGESRATLVQTGAAITLTGAALAPVLLKAISILRDARSHVIAPLPEWRALEHSFHWNLVLFCGAGSFVLAKLIRKASREGSAVGPVSGSSLILILSWWICQPAVLFLYSRLTGNSVFIPRYVSLMLPGAALAAAAAAARFLPRDRWKYAAALLGIGSFAVMGQWNVRELKHDNSDWRSAAREENRLAPDPGTPVICTSPFVEARSPVWTERYQLPGFLYAHLFYYPVRGKLYLFPYQSSSEAERFAAELLQNGTLTKSHRFLIYGPAGSVRYWRGWLGGRPELKDWSLEVKEFGDICLGIFEAGPASEVRAGLRSR